MKRNIILLVIAAGLLVLLPAATHLGNLLFDDRRNVIPYALFLIAALGIVLGVILDVLRWTLKRPRARSGM
jgi:hypothetical protein